MGLSIGLAGAELRDGGRREDHDSDGGCHCQSLTSSLGAAPGPCSRILTAFLKRVLSSLLRYPVIHTYAALKAEHRRTHAGAPDAEDACTFASASAGSPITQNKPHEDSADSDIEVSRKEKEENSAKSWHLPNQQ